MPTADQQNTPHRQLFRVQIQNALVLSLFAFLAIRQIVFVDEFAVNLMFMDQWTAYWPMFSGQGPLEMFFFQNGTLLQGVGGLLTNILARASGWNTRWDAFAASIVLVAAAMVAVRLSIGLGVRPRMALMVIPLLFFNQRQYDLFLAATCLAPSAVPLLLLMLCAWGNTLPHTALRVASVSLLTILLIFTGRGYFIILISPVLLGIEVFHLLKANRLCRIPYVLIGLLAITLSWWGFTNVYRSVGSGLDGFQVPAETALDYVRFLCLMLANFYGMTGVGVVALTTGAFTLGALTLVCGYHAYAALSAGDRNQPRHAVIFCLTAFTLAYCAATTITRVSFGLQAAGTSRYVTLIIPGAMGIFLSLGTLRSRAKAALLNLGYASLIALGTLRLHSEDLGIITRVHASIELWKKTYLETCDSNEASKVSQIQIYPRPIEAKLQFLQQNRLNLFLDYSPSTKSRCQR